MSGQFAGMPEPRKRCAACNGAWYEGHYCGTGSRPAFIRRRLAVLLTVALITYAGSGFACSESDVSKVRKKVDQAASILLTAAKSNRELYRSGSYGTVGSPEAITKRQTIAKAIHDANEYLSDAVELAAQLQPGMSGQAVIDLLAKAASELASTKIGNDRIDILIQSAVAAINSAVLIAKELK